MDLKSLHRHDCVAGRVANRVTLRSREDNSFEPNAKKEVFDQVLKIATLFAKHGVTNVHTYCISIDGESRIVSVTQAKVKY